MTGVRAARRDPGRTFQGDLGSIARYDELVVGRYSWVPDDDAGGSASAELAELPVHWLKDWMLCLDVECGPRPGTALHRLYGTVIAFDPGTGSLEFSPAGGHTSVGVPLHRVVALTGDRQRRRIGQVPAHEPYDDGSTT
ncbi:hypothetical protein [Streptomyces uncialis]|uniref:Uncharacterized protein n=1 Tax=Streptomyces uncialis TaxID=1048205 RepID=A0A1Q4V937_9ACTN|nr:hypothetical protein [Streptomyces uncialis]OKH94361.1 hypothetical protein AB852_08495 [Streptomyces uncialis]